MRHLNLFLSTVLALLVDNIKWRVVVKTAALLIELSTPADCSNKYPNKHQLTAWHLPLTSTHLALNVAIGNGFDCISIEGNNKLLLLFRLDKSIEWLINQGPTAVKHNSFIICFWNYCNKPLNYGIYKNFVSLWSWLLYEIYIILIVG